MMIQVSIDLWTIVPFVVPVILVFVALLAAGCLPQVQQQAMAVSLSVSDSLERHYGKVEVALDRMGRPMRMRITIALAVVLSASLLFLCSLGLAICLPEYHFWNPVTMVKYCGLPIALSVWGFIYLTPYLHLEEMLDRDWRNVHLSMVTLERRL